MKKGFSCKSDNLHLNRIATASVFAIRFKCKSFLPAGKTWLPKNPLSAGKRRDRLKIPKHATAASKRSKRCLMRVDCRYHFGRADTRVTPGPHRLASPDSLYLILHHKRSAKTHLTAVQLNHLGWIGSRALMRLTGDPSACHVAVDPRTVAAGGRPRCPTARRARSRAARQVAKSGKRIARGAL